MEGLKKYLQGKKFFDNTKYATQRSSNRSSHSRPRADMYQSYCVLADLMPEHYLLRYIISPDILILQAQGLAALLKLLLSRLALFHIKTLHFLYQWVSFTHRKTIEIMHTNTYHPG